MRLGIFGGTFDPPHVGHLLAATDAYEQLRLDRLIFMPAATQPLKTGQTGASARQRLEMVRLTVRDDPRFEVSDVEVARGGLSFTVDTLTHFAARNPGAELLLLLGEDVLASFNQWREPQRVLQLSRLVLLQRQQAPVGAGNLPDAPPGAVRLATRRVDVSSTEIRERVRAGAAIHGFVTDDVAAYIAREGLYR